jgi:hypothetical protein
MRGRAYSTHKARVLTPRARRPNARYFILLRIGVNA